ncbi:hypothetical protein LAN87_003030 [Salmonella enterica]|nr:hypothetical protein [Salmonella enterica]HCM1832460.1 hypothetical protein [Salmonella enterica subsp. salamae serovar 48:z81:z39]EHX3572943.1 hypothetical protein [Salmonella enterica]EIB6274980.1 hypothetical protein [Salmonella enterica]EIC8062219.1 hypothetical protein [Salmonella enterica]
MHFHKRTLLSVATLGMLAVSVVLMVVWVRNSNHSLINTDEFLCMTRTVTTIQPKDIHADGSLVLDFKMKRITLQYEIQTKDSGVKILYRDVYMKNLHRTAPGVYTFEVSLIKVFATDTAGDLFAHLRVLHPEAANEIRIAKVGEKTFFYSLNRQLYNICTAQ